MDLKTLITLIEDDEYGILSIKTAQSKQCNSNEHLISRFEEINKFVRENRRLPEPDKDIQEFKLYQRLKELNSDKSKISDLQRYDEFNLLTYFQKPSSIEDILKDEAADFLEDQSDIFNLTHIPKTPINLPDYVAKRKPCTDFENYETLFKQCQGDLSAGKRKTLPFSNPIEKGLFFVLKGVLLYIADVGLSRITNGHTNARLRCIFENKTESDVLMRSLAAELYKDGRLVTEHQDRLLDKLNKISLEDKEAGYVYVVKSLSKSQKISSISNLHKIGFSKTLPDKRIKNAHRDPTFLMAPVTLVDCYRCFNLNPQKLELLLHRFLGKTCLNIDVYDSKEKRHTPREWFIVPLHVIEQVIQLIRENTIDKYRYDLEKQEVFLKEDLILTNSSNENPL